MMWPGPKKHFVNRIIALGPKGAQAIRAIEFGSGHGVDAELLSDRPGWDVLATDSSSEMLESVPTGIARRRLDVTQPIPVGISGFDIAYCSFLLHLIPEGKRPTFLCNVLEVLRPGGLFVCLTASHSDLERRVYAPFFPSALGIDAKRYGSVQENLRAMEQAGFRKSYSERIYLGEIDVGSNLRFYRERHSSVLRLIPEEEFSKGLAELEAMLLRNRVDGVKPKWWRTLLIAEK